MIRKREILLATLIVLAITVGALPALAQDTAPSRTTPTLPARYTEAQGERGEEVFDRVCATCHKAPALAGPTFRAAWNGQPVGKLYTFISTMMPNNDPGSLSEQQYADLAAYILKLNGYPAGKEELPPDADALASFLLELK
jgi:mono/diheme cytochrome c family protein